MKGFTIHNVIEIHVSTHLLIVFVELSRLSLAMFHGHNLKLFILLLISPLPRHIKGSGNYSEFVPLVINTWAGNHEVATDKGDETTAVYSICPGEKLSISL